MPLAAAALYQVEAALADAVKASLGLPEKERPHWIGLYLIARLDSSPTPPVPAADKSDESVAGQLPPLAAELCNLYSDI